MNESGTLDPIRGAFRAVTAACVPAAEGLTPEEWGRAESIVNDALASRPRSVRRQLVLFVRILGLLARVRFGRALTRLGPQRTRALLGSLERSPVLLLRRGTWGLRTLAFMGYYGQEGVRRALGYRAAPQGWEVRRAGQGPWPGRRDAAPPEQGVLTAHDDAPGAPGTSEPSR